MILRKANHADLMKVVNALRYKDLPYITKVMANYDYNHNRLFVVAEENKVYATLSMVEEKEYGYTAVKRLCILNKKNQGKGIARFALHEIQKEVKGRIGATPWDNNDTMKHLLETEGFKMEYKFMEHWCFYVKEV